MTTSKVTIEFTIPGEWDTEDFVAELVGCYCDTAGWDDETDTPKPERVEYQVINTTEKGNK
jgi:hypothetical protein